MNRIIPIHVYQPESFKTESKTLTDQINGVPKDELPIIEIFETIEGEGLHIGTPRVLVRVAGCLVGCDWCDTKHSWGTKGFERFKLPALVEKIAELSSSVREISITGGEPMHYPEQMIVLSDMLKQHGYVTSMETSGIIVSQDVFEHFDHVSLDIKTPSSGVPLSRKGIYELEKIACHHPGLQFKAVVSNMEDLNWIEKTLLFFLHPTYKHAKPLVLTPAAGEGFSPEKLNQITQMIAEWNRRYHIRVISQQHQLLGYA